METEKLISALSKDKNHSTRLSVRTSCIIYLVVVLASLSLGVFASGIRDDFATKIFDPMFAALILSSILGSIFSGVLVIILSVPGQSSPRLLKICMFLGLVWLVLLGVSVVHQYNAEEGFALSGAECSEMLLALSLLPGAVLLWLVNRNAPTRYFLGGVLIFSSASFASFSIVEVHCASTNGLHLLLHHGAPALLLSILGVFLGRKLMNWDRRIEKTKNSLG